MQPPRPNFDPRQHPPMQPGSQPPQWSSQGMNLQSQQPGEKWYPIEGLSADQKHYRRPDGQVVAIRNPDVKLVAPSFVCGCGKICRYFATNHGGWHFFCAAIVAPTLTIVLYLMLLGFIVSTDDQTSKLIGVGVFAALFVGAFVSIAVAGHRWACLLKRGLGLFFVLPALILYVVCVIFPAGLFP